MSTNFPLVFITYVWPSAVSVSDSNSFVNNSNNLNVFVIYYSRAASTIHELSVLHAEECAGTNDSERCREKIGQSKPC